MQVLGIIGYDIADVPSAGRDLPELWRGFPASNPAMSGVAEGPPGTGEKPFFSFFPEIERVDVILLQ